MQLSRLWCSYFESRGASQDLSAIFKQCLTAKGLFKLIYPGPRLNIRKDVFSLDLVKSRSHEIGT